MVSPSKHGGSGHKSGQALFVAQWEQPKQRLICRSGPVGSVLENAVICGYTERPADMVIHFNAWGASASFQVFLEGQGVIEQFRTFGLCQPPFFPCILQGSAEDFGIFDS